MDVYLVDYENVHREGLRGISHVLPENQVAVFYSGNPPEVDILRRLANKYDNSGLELFCHHKVWKNYEDFQLSTYLGYMVSDPSVDRIRIISKDHGFDAVVDFWLNAGINIRRQETICGKPLPETVKAQKIKADKKAGIEMALKSAGIQQVSERKFSEPYRRAVRLAVRKDNLKPSDYSRIYEAAEQYDLDMFRKALIQSISNEKGQLVYSHVEAIYKNFRSL